jgi:hypothetical protein
MDGWHRTQCTNWDCGLFGKVPHVQIGMVVGLKWCSACELGLWLFLA